MLIELNNVVKQYGRGENAVCALRDVSLAIDRNEFVGIMGKSGCGKTTLINIMATILLPDSGTYNLDGRSVNEFSEPELAACKRRTVAVVFQNYNLVEELTVQNNIILPYIFDKREYDHEYFNKIVEELGIGQNIHKYPAQLSGGEKQRAAIARALLVQPKVILADEPTGNLDGENAERVMEILRLCVDEYKQTVVMVTHDKDMAQYADRMVNMKDGRIVM
ncbi:MAG: ABC transporter ATP-binding protein [Lachnospiraceae bacterium]|nr:ABC transporter ATP-binding protein [Lachnospiraceae bacterium]